MKSFAAVHPKNQGRCYVINSYCTWGSIIIYVFFGILSQDSAKKAITKGRVIKKGVPAMALFWKSKTPAKRSSTAVRRPAEGRAATKLIVDLNVLCSVMSAQVSLFLESTDQIWKVTASAKRLAFVDTYASNAYEFSCNIVCNNVFNLSSTLCPCGFYELSLTRPGLKLGSSCVQLVPLNLASKYAQ